jgi:ribonuclease BN (tRNA processing enzyme)
MGTDIFKTNIHDSKYVMKVTLLGTNGWYDTPTGSTPCVIVQTNDYSILFDAGFGFSKADQYIDGDKPVYLFLSHFHYDHIIGLHTLAKCHFNRGLRVFGMHGIQVIMKGFFNPTLTIPLEEIGFPLTFEEFESTSPQDLPFEISALPLIHSGPCQGYRLEIEGRILTYCTDTGYCENAVTLAQGADLLLTECAVRPGAVVNPLWPHLNPSLAAQIAQEANVKQLVLIHFDASAPSQLRADAEEEARLIFSRTTAGLDGMTFEI